MGAAIHRLHEPPSRYTPEERTRIMSAARVASVQWKAEEQLRNAPTGPAASEVKHDHLADALARPIEDGLTRYQREANAAAERERAENERREREQRREQRQAQRAATAGWETWIAAEVERRVAAELRGRQDTIRELLKIFEQHNETFERIATRFDEVKRENVVLRGELAQARESFASLFAGVTQRLATLESDASKNVVTVEASFRAVSDELTRIRATPVVRYYLEALFDGPRD